VKFAGTVLLLLLVGLAAPSSAQVLVMRPGLQANMSQPGHHFQDPISNGDSLCLYDVHGRVSTVRAIPRTDDDTLEEPPPPDGNLGHNGFEPVETTSPETAWIDDGGDDLALSRTTPHLRGPPGASSESFTAPVPTITGGLAVSLPSSSPTVRATAVPWPRSSKRLDSCSGG
jgi:hypothetical protein